jgi:hypothetical protein
MNFTKKDLQNAFEQGEKHDYRPTWSCCFNKWYNITYIDAMKCNHCIYGSLKNNKNCKTCVEFVNFK